ncbi:MULTISPECIES: ATP-binding protein [Bacillus]|uniref:AAA+ ATPase domain-containing protein n=1 Tax=Bacillus wiedmannii TaxID=1890302 RepID=A0AB37YYV4_9BACI|nr:MULTISPECIES: ATP-binding protein [Bacillus]EJS73238.1 hypothetical protein ICW_00750 [Bacillus wiedmannii]EJV58597.1 hypothetical protein IEO_04402 [Bacillus wiedmannii]MDR4940012.1 ATP-binding protein [Bacillus wiedmannii]MED3315160.1 ATP-binding protein [Bacillus wiedmannii]OFD00244.1 hypothetical protein BTGOE6_42830 [Bacillus wiedmannii]
MVKIGNRIEKTNPSSSKEIIQKPSASFTTEKPKYSFDDIILNEKTKEELLNVLSYQKNSEVVFEEWGLNNTHKFSKKIGINLYGDPGTGKTMAAHAIAHKLQRDLMVVNYADIESKYVGETAKNLVHIFQVAKETNSILFFDEADAMLSRRVTNMSNSTDVSVNQTRSVLLMLLNDHQDIILFATNFISNFDPAFMRRILAHIHFSLPDAEQRENLWRKLIPRELPQSLDLTEMATEYPGVTGSDISNAILNAAFAAARKNESHVSDKYFKDSISNILKSKRHNHQQNIKTTDRIVDEKYVKTQLQK